MHARDAHQIDERRIRHLPDEVDTAHIEAVADLVEEDAFPGLSFRCPASITDVVGADENDMRVRARCQHLR